MATRAWVTGAQGFFGARAALALDAQGFDVIRIARRPWSEGSSSRCETVTLDEASLDSVADRHGAPDLIFHCAGNGSVGRSFEDPDADRHSAAGTTGALLAVMAARAPRACLIFPSSAAVYGEQGTAPLAEILKPAPVSPYGVHKLEAEALCRNSGLRTIVIRYFSLYGPGLRKQLFWDLAGKLNAAGSGKPVTLFGTGDETRDFLDVDDAVALAMHLFERRSEGVMLVNGGTGHSVRIRDAASLLRDALGHSNPLHFSGESTPGAPPHLVADVKHAAELGFTPEKKFEQGIVHYAEWVRREGRRHERHHA